MPSSHHTGPLRGLPVPRAHRREATPSSMATAVRLRTRLRGVGSRLWTRRDGAQGPWSSGGSGAGCRRDARAHGPDPRRGEGGTRPPRAAARLVQPHPVRDATAQDVRSRDHSDRNPTGVSALASPPDVVTDGQLGCLGVTGPRVAGSGLGLLPDEISSAPYAEGRLKASGVESPSARWRAQHAHTRRVPCRGDRAPRAGGVPSGARAVSSCCRASRTTDGGTPSPRAGYHRALGVSAQTSLSL